MDIRRRALALIIAAAAGYLVARALTARVKRLEHAARKVAAGDFSNPIHAESDDELGRLTQAFDDMQRQLAQLRRQSSRIGIIAWRLAAAAIRALQQKRHRVVRRQHVELQRLDLPAPLLRAIERENAEALFPRWRS